MKCFSFCERVREGIEISRGDQGPRVVTALNSATNGNAVRFSEEMREAIERIRHECPPDKALMLGRTHVEVKRDGVVLCRPCRADNDGHALVLIETMAGAGGTITWKCGREVRVLNRPGRYVGALLYQRLELWVVLPPNTKIEIERDGELEGAARTLVLSWDGTSLETRRLDIRHAPMALAHSVAPPAA